MTETTQKRSPLLNYPHSRIANDVDDEHEKKAGVTGFGNTIDFRVLSRQHKRGFNNQIGFLGKQDSVHLRIRIQ